jgi:D-tyrosyl-tRNA(Tyr) deacylase
MAAEESSVLYSQFIEKMKQSYKPEKIKDGVFGAYMQLHIQNDGPVTITLETPPNLGSKERKPSKPVESGRHLQGGVTSSAPRVSANSDITASNSKKQDTSDS